MRIVFLDSKEDCDWLRDKLPVCPTEWRAFKVAIVRGNEDSPDSADLWMDQEPLVTQDFYRVDFNSPEKSGVCKGQI